MLVQSIRKQFHWGKRLSIFLYNTLILPRSLDEDKRREEYILNVLLTGSLLLPLVAIIRLLIRLAYPQTDTHLTLRLIFLLSVVLLFFGVLLLLSRLKQHRTAAFLLILTYLFLASYTLLIWGIGNPQGLLIYALIIVMAGILTGTRNSLIITILTTASLFGITYLHTHAIITPNLSWTSELGRFSDAIGFGFSYLIIYLVTWLSNREIERSLARAHRSEAALREERNLLEKKVIERTEELRRTQEEKVIQLYRFAEFGRLASGLFHDLTNPLTSVSLNLEQLGKKERSTLLDRAISGTKYVERYVEAVRRQIRNEKRLSLTSIQEEIEHAIQALAYRARSQRVRLNTEIQEDIVTYCSPVKLHQLILNLVANAIDAYPTNRVEGQRREVLITLTREDNKAILCVIDWGSGITKENLSRIFEPFFTTKAADKGTGIGLTISREIAEKELEGTLQVDSAEGVGTTFTATFPIRSNPEASEDETTL